MSEETQEVGEGAAPAGGTPAEPRAASGPIVARAGAYYRRARYLLCALAFIVGLWFCYDGFVGYPAYNRKFAATKPEERIRLKMESPHDALGIRFQKEIGLTLPVAGVLALAFFLYRSRGEYRLENRTLFIPGHPPIPLDRITELDRSLWDRKGILIVRYSVPDTDAVAKARLDDFVYERTGTDAIVEALKQQLFPAEAGNENVQG